MTTPGSPAVSVVITCYNYARYVVEAARSVLDQEGVDLELIIVDDVSSDDSLAVIRGIAEGDARVRVVARAVNGGAAAAFNDGLSRVRGRAWVRLDADDVLTPGALRRALDVLDAEPRVGLVYGRPLFAADGEPRPAPQLDVTTWSVWRGRDWLAGRFRDGRSVIASVEVMVRTAASDEVGGMSLLRNAHDFELWMRIAARWEVARLDGVHQGCHRIHGASLSQGHMSDPLLGIHKRELAFRELLGSGVLPDEEIPALTEAMERALAAEALDHAMHQWDRGRFDDAELARGIRQACATYPRVAELPAYRAAVQRLGADRAHPLWRATSLGAALRRRLVQEFGDAVLRRTGVHTLWAARRRDTYPAPTR